ncbi:hypothetical protein OHS33_39235 (plasmid) [Streptomyces sp. NBC_00536]|uniref:hypothetical protein n=1 Tax=Streptomyces sp. NBC_00536 TaxID=2975769 RepID=UPI002E80D354|nr:hypothetical protein [Streptomyces sp. NBC_00536]WUC84394.1 hypothetical protein OHS33_39235 [Streptomyces sp. NBC_00536]
MSTTAPVTLLPDVAAVISTLKAVGLGAFYDADDRAVIAHPIQIPQEHALNGTHVMVQWGPYNSGLIYGRPASFRATEWVGDGPDLREMGTIYATPIRRPFTREAQRCANAIREWMLRPGYTAGAVLLAALAEYGLTPGNGISVAYNVHSDSYDIPVTFSRGEQGRLSVADRDGSIRHLPGRHTGWSILLHDERGDAVGDPVHISGDGRTSVDCAADSESAAAVIADWVTAPLSRHCDCYAQEGHYPRHDRECNRYAAPSIARSQA